MGTFLSAIDIASYQEDVRDLLIAEFNPDLVVVRMYLATERPSPMISRDEVTAAKAAGKMVLSYCWLYATADPVATANEAIALARTLGCDLDAMFADIETYNDGSIPNGQQIAAFGAACDAAGVPKGLYSSVAMWGRVASSIDLTGWLLWVANYGSAPAAITVAPFGSGGRVVGWQWTSDPIDESIFAPLPWG